LKRVFLSLALVFLILVSTVTIIAPPKVQAWEDVKFRGTVESEPIFYSGSGIFFAEMIVEEVLTGDLDVGERLAVTWVYNLPLVEEVHMGDRVEVFGMIEYPGSGSVYLSEAHHYLRKIGVSGPADLVVYRCWVSPANPKQEDAVTFYAVIGNTGGSDANNFRLETYLDGSLYDSGSLSLRAGQQAQVWSDIPWRAEDGSHTVRWVINPDRSVEESNYGNNEASCSFFVSPRTVTVTVTTTKTSTRTQTQRTETTVTVTRTTMITRTTDTTVLRTVTASPTTVTQTLTGLITSTVYSPTVTVTVTSTAQMVSNPVLWLLLSAFAMIGAVVQLPESEKLRRLLPELARRIIKRHGRRALFAVSLISLIAVSVLSQAGQQAYASTVTTTRTATATEWTTLTKSLTSTRYITSTATDTSFTIKRTSTILTTVTPTVTRTTDWRSTTTIYVPTTITTTTQSATTQGFIGTYLTLSVKPHIIRSGESVEVTLGGRLRVAGTNIGISSKKVFFSFEGRQIGEATTEWFGYLTYGGSFQFTYTPPALQEGTYIFGVSFPGDSTFKPSSATTSLSVSSKANSYKVYVTVQPSWAVTGTITVYMYDSQGNLLETQMQDAGTAGVSGYGTGPYNFEFIITGSPPDGDYRFKASVVYVIPTNYGDLEIWGCVQRSVYIDRDGMNLLLIPILGAICP